MSQKNLALRRADFREHHLLWLVVRHYLSADLLKELCVAIIDVASASSLSLADLCEHQSTRGNPALSNWAIKLKPRDGVLHSYLQRLVQVVIWQGDQVPGVHDRDSAGSDLPAMLALEAAMEIAHADLFNITNSAANRSPCPAPLKPLVDAMLNLSGKLEDENPVESLFDLGLGCASLLGAVLVKHLGDLCGDADRWDVALKLYSDAETILARCAKGPWGQFKISMKTMLAQSRAAALRITEGPAFALEVLESIVDGRTIDKNLVAVMNSAPDLMTAHHDVN